MNRTEIGLCGGRPVRRRPRRHSASRRILWALAAPLFLTHCTKDTVEISEETRTLIRPTGGEAKSAAGELTLTFAGNTFSEPTTVIVRTDRDRTIPRSVGPAFDLSTDPPRNQFSVPVGIAIKNPGNSPDVAIANADGPVPVIVVGGTYDPLTKIARANLEHFSSYLLVSTTTTSTPTDCPARQPTSGDPCTTAPGIECLYGTDCCCGNCYPATECECTSGQWSCAPRGVCILATCPDGGTLPDTGTSTPTPTCDAIEAEYQYLTGPGFRVCSDSGDCHVVMGHCGVGLGGCDYTLNATITQSRLDLLGHQYSALGCTAAVCACQPPPNSAICDNNVCVPGP